MVTITSGNLFESKTQTLVNTVNCVGVMGKGIALEFKKRYPDMFTKYKTICDKGLLKTGNLWLYKSDKWILNFPTKQHWKNDSKIEYLVAGLDKFISTYKEKGITSISFPLLGASNGGLDPVLVKELMVSKLSECSIPIMIYESQYTYHYI
jgi:O-acetyl-ADP-ribose deacetylase (regulator of RNase III)